MSHRLSRSAGSFTTTRRFAGGGPLPAVPSPGIPDEAVDDPPSNDDGNKPDGQAGNGETSGNLAQAGKCVTFQLPEVTESSSANPGTAMATSTPADAVPLVAWLLMQAVVNLESFMKNQCWRHRLGLLSLLEQSCFHE